MADDRDKPTHGVMALRLVALVFPCACGVSWRVPVEVLTDAPMWCPVCGGPEGDPSPEMEVDEQRSRHPKPARRLRSVED